MSLWLLIGAFVIKLIKVYLFGHLVQCPLNSQKAGKRGVDVYVVEEC